eukprot:scaffold1733_cov391-Prasinococcus_capsulatus_cf.AAC.7
MGFTQNYPWDCAQGFTRPSRQPPSSVRSPPARLFKRNPRRCECNGRGVVPGGATCTCARASPLPPARANTGMTGDRARLRRGGPAPGSLPRAAQACRPARGLNRPDGASVARRGRSDDDGVQRHGQQRARSNRADPPPERDSAGARAPREGALRRPF